MWDFEDDLSQTVLDRHDPVEKNSLKEQFKEGICSSETASKRNSLSQAIDWESSDDEKHDTSRVEQNSQIKISENSSQERNLSSCKSSKRLNFEHFVKDNDRVSKRQKLRVGVTDHFGISSNNELVSCSQDIDQISSDAEDDDLPNFNPTQDPSIHTRKKCNQRGLNVAGESNSLKGTEWLKNIEEFESEVKCPSRESTQVSIHSESASEGGVSNHDEAIQDNRRSELWDSSKKKKVKRGGLAEKWEEMIKNESSDRALKEHFKEKDSIMGANFANELQYLVGTVLEYEIGFDGLIRLRCKKQDSHELQSFSTISQTYEVILNKDESNEIDVSQSINSIQLHRPFVEVQLLDYKTNRKNETLTVISNPSLVKIIP